MSWENGSLNEVNIEGYLSEVKLEETKDKDGMDIIRGEYKIKTSNMVGDKEIPVEIPIRVYQPRLTKNKKDNPAYASAKKIMTDFTSIAAGGLEKATAIYLSDKWTSLQENFFKSRSGQMVFSSAIRASFAGEANKSELKPHAKFKVIVVVGEIKEEIDRNDNETGRYILKGIIPQYGGRADVVDFIIDEPKVIDHIKNNWNKGDTVLIGGYINFSSVTTETVSAQSFGEPIVETHTKSIREFVITGGHDAPLTEEEGAYSNEDIAVALKDRQARIEKAKEKEISQAANTNNTATTTNQWGF